MLRRGGRTSPEAFAGVLLVACTLMSRPASALEISEVRSGLVCSDDDGRPAWVCHQTADIHLTGEGSCVYDRRPARCTWYGLSFEYSGNVPGTLLDCEFSQSHSSALGNPDGVEEEDVRSGRYALPLEQVRGRFFNPQYSLFDATAGIKTQTVVTRCAVDGREVLSFSFDIHYPGS